MTSANILRCEKCGHVALVVHQEHPLCVECLMAKLAQSREQRLILRDVKPIRSEQLKKRPLFRSANLYR